MKLTIPCKLCEAPTPLLGARMCDNCYEVTGRLEAFLKSSIGRQHVLEQLLTRDLARAILRMDNIGYEEGLGPRTAKQVTAWGELLATAELIADDHATSTRMAALEKQKDANTADRKLNEADRHISDALDALKEIVIDRCWGHDEYYPEYHATVQEVFASLLTLRTKLNRST